MTECCGKTMTQPKYKGHRSRYHLKPAHCVFEGDVHTGEVPELIDETEDPMYVEMCESDVEMPDMLVVNKDNEEGMFTAVIGEGPSSFDPREVKYGSEGGDDGQFRR